MSSIIKRPNTAGKKYPTCIYWFRNAIRFHDNPSLLDACNQSNSVLPLFIIDPDEPFSQTQGRRAGCIRANFVLESLKDLDQKIRNISSLQGQQASQLFVLVGKPVIILPQIVEKFNIDAIFYEREPAAPTRHADAMILDAIKSFKTNEHVTFVGYDTHTLHPMEHYLAHCKNQVAPSQYGAFTKIFYKLGTVAAEVPSVSQIPPPPLNTIQLLKQTVKSNIDYNVPSLQSLGYNESCLVTRAKGGLDFIGGEDAGLQLLKKMMKRTQWVCTFEKPNTKPNTLTVDTTGLSPYIKHGCVSSRRFYHELSRVYSQYPTDKVSKPPVSLHGQLLWREYNNLMGYTTPHFDKMRGNTVARQIPWDDDPAIVEKWKNSQTGYPFIDAIMAQLRQTGWIHHLARHAVACFLTRGDLWQSWEVGAAIFEELLIDADWSINNFNWQWLSCTAHFYQYFRCYSPISFGKKTDPNGDYIRKWLPQFQNMPKKYIYEPWLAPIEIQRKTGVIVGETYPEPIVDHASVCNRNMGRMKEAYDAHKLLSGVALNEGEVDDSGSDVEEGPSKKRPSSATKDSTGKKKKA